MPVPSFNGDGVIPPYIGPQGPGGAPNDMSPYFASCVEVVQALGTTPQRNAILKGWLDHRAALRAAGFLVGRQWLDGSFVENKVPNDLDLVTIIRRPAAFKADPQAFIQTHGHLTNHGHVKQTFRLDLFLVDLDGDPDIIVNLVRYYFGLFSHRRSDDLWKGLLEVNLVDNTEGAAMAAVVGAMAAPQALVGGGP